LVFYRIIDGNYGNVNIDSLEVIYAVSWPKAIHEGSGTMQLYITRSADAEQRQAIVSIFTGKVRGDGPFAIFAPTLDYVLEPQFVDINARLDGKKSSFSVPGVIEVQLENFINPVTGDVQEIKIQLPNGFIWKIADAAKTKVMKILAPKLNFDHSGKNAFYSKVEFSGP
jgi:hypothetical protein